MKHSNEKTFLSSNDGFSLKELVAVMAIILILVSVISAFFVKYIEKTNEQTDVYNMKIVQREAEASFALGRLDIGSEYYFDESSGCIVEEEPSSGYGKGTVRNGGVYFVNYIPQMNVVGDVLCAKAGNTGVEIYWKGYEPVSEEEDADNEE